MSASEKEAKAQLYRQWSEQGDAYGHSLWGYCHYWGYGGVSQDDKRALELYGQSADQNNNWGQYMLGYCYYEGDAVGRDYKRAFELYGLSADQGNSAAQYMFGFCYYRGFGVQSRDKNQDKAAAKHWFTLAAAQGDERAQSALPYL